MERARDLHRGGSLALISHCLERHLSLGQSEKLAVTQNSKDNLSQVPLKEKAKVGYHIGVSPLNN